MFKRSLISVAVLAILQSGCGDDGSSGSASLPSGTSVSGTVPGTVIEAYGDNGSYYAVKSTDDGTAMHPFTLDVPAGVGFHMVMITGDGTSEEVVTPIGFRDSSGRVRTRLMLDKGEQVDLGHVPLHMGRNAAAQDDLDDDGVLDHPLVLDDVGAGNPLSLSDVDDDGVNDWDDDDHGGYHYHSDTVDPQDHDDDGIPNVYDHDHAEHPDDRDGDGLPDHIDANPDNDPDHGNDALDGDCDGDGYHDEDHDHDGYYDDDHDRDGYHDDDYDYDGDHDSDHDDDGVDDDENEAHSCGGDPGTTPPAPVQPPTPDQTSAPVQPPAPDQTSAPVQPPAPAEPPAAPPAALDGQALYTNSCSSCHGASGVNGTTAPQITSAISGNLGGMGSIALTPEEIQAIANYLAL
ncbi:MAG: cytochrome c [Gammaproteobacteria bacterium]|nr:cytochrome c [Gammaproteobacteria bacterium]